jgi:sodium-dependent phosphate cotransporter
MGEVQTFLRGGLKGGYIVLLIFLFLLAIDLLSASFGLFGKPLATSLLNLTADPFVGLFIGILATAIVQSSSFTTSLVVAMVSSGALPFSSAIPIVMGANIGTSITNTLVSLVHMSRSTEFEKAFAAATVHDFFNLLAVLVLFPLEIFFHVFEKIAEPTAAIFYGQSQVSGVESPLKHVLTPLVKLVQGAMFALGWPNWLVALAGAIFGFVMVFFVLTSLVKQMKSSFSGRIEGVVHVLFGKAGIIALMAGVLITALIQSSSVTTSMMVPLAAAGLVTLEQAYPFTLGANIGTTVTALIAALAGNQLGLAIAFVHLYFNLFGTCLFYGIRYLRPLPIFLARLLARHAVRHRAYAFVYVVITFFLIPLAVIALRVFWHD